jgi:Tn3 transposase DDE domain
MGIRQMAVTGEHGVGEAELRHVRATFVTRENLRAAITTVVNATLEARDPAWWGEATSTASDSKRFASWDSNLMTEFDARYGRGVLIYWHVERKSMVIHSQVINCTASEVAAMIEGAMHHGTSMDVEANYTDTHGVVVTWTPLVPLASLAPGCNQSSGDRAGRIRRCLCGYGSSAVKTAPTGSTCSMRTVSRSRSCRGSCGSWRPGTARPTRWSPTPTTFVTCGGSSTVTA